MRLAAGNRQTAGLQQGCCVHFRTRFHSRPDPVSVVHLRRFIVERDIAGIGSMSLTELCGAARASNQAIEQIGGDVQWQHSYVASDKTFCVYLARDEATIAKHAELSGIPVSSITEVSQIIDPLTANN
ncbi:MAG: DUF4242 domain-containing protein [Woeseiaceae bacterium]|nr:DUF4242 domain-containing protein [Woeseiaceae bacterium]